MRSWTGHHWFRYGLSPERHQAITWTNAGILLIEPLGANFSENLIAILTFSFTKMRLKVSSAKWRPFCLGLNVSMCIWFSFRGITWVRNNLMRCMHLYSTTMLQLTHWGRDKMAAISQTTLSNDFFRIIFFLISIKISLRFVPWGLVNNIPALVLIMAWRRPGDKPLSEPMITDAYMRHSASMS